MLNVIFSNASNAGLFMSLCLIVIAALFTMQALNSGINIMGTSLFITTSLF